jgi:hypothetical protein
MKLVFAKVIFSFKFKTQEYDDGVCSEKASTTTTTTTTEPIKGGWAFDIHTYRLRSQAGIRLGCLPSMNIPESLCTLQYSQHLPQEHHTPHRLRASGFHRESASVAQRWQSSTATHRCWRKQRARGTRTLRMPQQTYGCRKLQSLVWTRGSPSCRSHVHCCTAPRTN